ncbi:EamA family transporter [Pseudonocardia ammonioxydans]|uniref:EamA family transporter n=1 Tax=Pseudonocardia ammonioxydans TaxID=260086 RepID=UPI001FE2F303|nr:EamA family transporter [Pseudonocardia ammonioxydans]
MTSQEAQATPQLSAVTASARRRAAGVATILGSSASNQTGAAIGALAFPAIGPVGVVAVRQLVTAAVLVPVVRPRLRSMSGAQLRPVLGLAVAFGVMNLCLYTAIERIGLGLAVTLEFLGPLAVAIGASRRAVDALGALLAAIGVVVLVDPGPSSDVAGIAAALTAALAWAAYILLNRDLGRRLPGLQGTAAASLAAATVWLPIAVWWFVSNPPTPMAVLLATVCAVMASVVPFVADLSALRRVPAGLFGTLTSVNPIWAALAGWLVLQQALTAAQWMGITMIVAGNAAVTTASFLRAGPSRTRSARPAGS